MKMMDGIFKQFTGETTRHDTVDENLKAIGKTKGMLL